MRKIIKIGFPIFCVVVIGGTFILLNKTAKKINENSLKQKNSKTENSIENDNNANNTSNATSFTVSLNDAKEESKTQENKKQKAIDLVKEKEANRQNVYYTNEGIDENGYYLIAIRDKTTTEAIIYYKVNIETEEMYIY